jgi:hypothetical protein
MNKRLHNFLWIQVVAFNADDEHRNKGTLRNQEAVCGIEEMRSSVWIGPERKTVLPGGVLEPARASTWTNRKTRVSENPIKSRELSASLRG